MPVAAFAEEFALAQAVGTPVWIVDLFFKGFGAVFDSVTGMMAVFLTFSVTLVACAVAFVAMLFSGAVAALALYPLFCPV